MSADGRIKTIIFDERQTFFVGPTRVAVDENVLRFDAFEQLDWIYYPYGSGEGKPRYFRCKRGDVEFYGA